MRRRLRQVAFLCLLVTLALLAERRSSADIFKPSRRVGPAKPNRWSVGLQGGVRYVGHYNDVKTISIAPSTLLGEVQVVVWYETVTAFYGLYSTNVAPAKSQMYGGGVKAPLVSFTSSSRAAGGIRISLLFDVVRYSMQEPDSTQAYDPRGTLFRYGVGATWYIGNSRFYLDGAFMVTIMNGAFFAAPVIAAGIQF